MGSLPLHFQYTTYIWPLLASAVVAALLGVLAWDRRAVPGATPFIVLMVTSTVWALANSLEMAGADLPTKLIWANLQYVCYGVVPAAVLLMVLEFTGLRLRVRHVHPLLFALEPALIQVLLWTNDLHGLMRRGVFLDTSGPFPAIGKTYGPAALVHFLYAYVLMLASLVLLLRAIPYLLPLFRRQAALLLFGLALPLVWNVLYVLRLSPVPTHDLAPAVLSLAGLPTAWGLFRYRLFDLVPLARDKVIDSMADGMLVIDRHGRVLDTNPAAVEIVGKVAGRQATDVLCHWPELCAALGPAPVAPHSASIHRGDRYYEVRVSPLGDRQDEYLGRVLVFREVTEQRLQQDALQQQARRLQIQHEIDRSILAAHLPTDIGNATLDHLRELVPCDCASIVVFDPDMQRVQFLSVSTDRVTPSPVGSWLSLEGVSIPMQMLHGEACLVNDVFTSYGPCAVRDLLLEQGMCCHLSVPLLVEHELIGTLNLASSTPSVFTPAMMAAAQEVATPLALAIQHARLFDQVRQSREQLQSLAHGLVEAQERERRSIARELHDEAGQGLTAIMLGLSMIQRAPDCEKEVSRRLEELKQLTGNVMEGLHRLAVNLRPASLDRLGLVPALEQLVASFRERSALAVELDTTGLGEQRLPPEVEITLYRFVQEALTNITKYARAGQVHLLLQRRAERVVALVEDDGIGFDPAQATNGGQLGLVGIQERVEMLGGHLTIESAPGQGTLLHVEVPVPDVPTTPTLPLDSPAG